MERLPYIDEHRLRVEAPREQVWDALISLLRAQLGATPAPLRQLLGLVPAELRGDWRGTPRRGDALPGFEVVEIRPPARLALRGRHRFSRYALAFELDASDATACTLRAQSSAAFPGLTGRAYRAMVIGTGAHKLIVRRMLRHVDRRL
jgi:hypothetical protein